MAEAENKVYFGLSNVHVAFAKGDGEWDTPIHVPGAVELTKDAEGDQNVFYADNIAYYTVNSNAGYSGELTMAKFPNDIMAKMLGWRVDKNGALIEVADGVPTPFALFFEVNGDQRKRRSVIYNVTTNRPSEDWSTTEDTTDVTTYAMPFTATPIDYEGEKIVQASIERSEENGDLYDKFYQAVYLPDMDVE